MKSPLLALIFLSFSIYLSAQKSGFAGLAYAKTSLESAIKRFGSSIPDTSAEYKVYFMPISRLYDKAKAQYEEYKGGMKDCVLQNDKEKNMKKCLAGLTINIQGSLDSLDNLLSKAYFEFWMNHSVKDLPPNYTQQNTSAVGDDFVKEIISSLLDAGLKIWEAIQKKNQDFRTTYLNQIQEKDYLLSDIQDLLKLPVKNSLEKSK